MNGCLIHSICRSQATIALSSCEAELYAANTTVEHQAYVPSATSSTESVFNPQGPSKDQSSPSQHKEAQFGKTQSSSVSM